MGYDVHLVKPDLGGHAADDVSDRGIDVRFAAGAVISGIFPDGGFASEE